MKMLLIMSFSSCGPPVNLRHDGSVIGVILKCRFQGFDLGFHVVIESEQVNTLDLDDVGFGLDDLEGFLEIVPAKNVGLGHFLTPHI